MLPSALATGPTPVATGSQTPSVLVTPYPGAHGEGKGFFAKDLAADPQPISLISASRPMP